MNKLKNFRQLVGNFETEKEEQMYRAIEKKFDLKQKYTERDWLTQNR